MNHFKIVKESFRLVLKHRYLWFLGLFLGGGIGSSFYNIPSNWNSNNFNHHNSGNVASLVSANVKDAGQVLGEKIGSNINNTEWLIAATLIILFIVLLIYLGITAKGAATWATVKLHEDKKFNLKDAWNTGHKYFWRRLSYDIIVGASILVIMAILATPIILLAIFEIFVPAIIFGILFGLVFVVFISYLSLFLPYSERILFLEDKKNFEAIFAGLKLFNKNWANIVLMYLLLFVISIGTTIGIVIALLASGLIAFGIGAAFYYINHVIGYVIGGTIGFAIIIALITFGGALKSFYWSVITLTYKEIR